MDNKSVFDYIVLVITSVLGMVVGALSWFFKSKLNSYDRKHEDHYRHSSDIAMHENDRERDATKLKIMELNNTLIRHIDRDDERFDLMDKKLDAIGSDIKELIRATSNK